MVDRFQGDLAEQRERLAKQAEVGREELARRAEEIREQFAEHVTQEAVTGFAGWTLVSAGVAWGVTDWMRGRRGLQDMLLPIALIVLGTAVLGGGSAWRRRSMHIDEAEMRVREELSHLGPFARSRVIKDMAEEGMPLVRRMAGHN
jgi:hypothetical protein